MTTTNFRSSAFAVLALGAGLLTSSAFAQDRFAEPSDAGFVYAQPIDAEQAVVPPNVRGQYTCAFNEVHSRLERKSCAGSHYRY